VIEKIQRRASSPITAIRVPCEAPAMYHTIYGSAPVMRGEFQVRLSNGRTLTR